MASHKVFVQGRGDYRINLKRGVSGTVHVLKPKEHTDVTVYVSGLFQEDRFIAKSALAIQSIIGSLIPQQTFDTAGSIGLASSFDDFTNAIVESLASMIGLDSSVNFAKSMGYGGDAKIALFSDIDGVIQNLISGADNLGVTFDIDLLSIGKEFEAESKLGILAALDGLLQTVYFSAAEQLGLDGAAEFVKALIFSVTESNIGLDSMIDGQIAKYIDAIDGIGITSAMDATDVQNLIEASSGLTISPVLSELIIQATISAGSSLGIDGDATVTSGKLFDGSAALALRAVIGAVLQSCIEAVDELGVDASMDSVAHAFIHAAADIGINAEISTFVSNANIYAESAMSIDGSVSLGYILVYRGESSIAIDSGVNLNTGKPIEADSAIAIDLGAGNLLAEKDYDGDAEIGLFDETVSLVQRILAEAGEGKLGIIDAADFGKGVKYNADASISITGEGDITKVLIIDGENEIGIELDADGFVKSIQLIAHHDLAVDADAGMSSKDLFGADHTAAISADGEYVSGDLISGNTLVTIDASADLTMMLIRMRLLSDMDEFNLSKFDGMTMGELTYIEIEH